MTKSKKKPGSPPAGTVKHQKNGRRITITQKKGGGGKEKKLKDAEKVQLGEAGLTKHFGGSF